MRLLPVLLWISGELHAKNDKEFDLSRASISRDEIFSGGPPKDGIPSIDQPQFVPTGQVDFLQDDDIVIGLTLNNTSRAYPLRILVWHEIVNDTIAGTSVAVTYCPLCGTAMVFASDVAGQKHSFGVSGLLYQSDVLMYDRETNSLWSQLKMEAVAGPKVGQKLTWLPSEHLTWKAWKVKHPQGQVLSPDTGYRRNYKGQAYAGYFKSEQTLFPVPLTRKEFSNKTWVLGIIVDGVAKAYPVDQLPDQQKFADTIGSTTIHIQWDAHGRNPTVSDASGAPMPAVMAFWFAWQAFYPDTEIWKHKPKNQQQ